MPPSRDSRTNKTKRQHELRSRIQTKATAASVPLELTLTPVEAGSPLGQPLEHPMVSGFKRKTVEANDERTRRSYPLLRPFIPVVASYKQDAIPTIEGHLALADASLPEEARDFSKG